MTTAEWRAVFRRLAKLAFEANGWNDFWEHLGKEAKSGEPPIEAWDVVDDSE